MVKEPLYLVPFGSSVVGVIPAKLRGLKALNERGQVSMRLQSIVSNRFYITLLLHRDLLFLRLIF